MGDWPPLQIAFLAGAARKAGHETRTFDAMNKKLSFEDIRAEIEGYHPDFVISLDYGEPFDFRGIGLVNMSEMSEKILAMIESPTASE